MNPIKGVETGQSAGVATGWGGAQCSYDPTPRGSSPLMSRMKGRAGWEKAPGQTGPEVDPS